MAQPGLPTPLYIGGLPLGITDGQVHAIFNAYSPIETAILLEQLVGSDCRNALIYMRDPNMAQWLTQNLNGNIPQGLTTPVTVQYLNAAAGLTTAPPPAPAPAPAMPAMQPMQHMQHMQHMQPQQAIVAFDPASAAAHAIAQVAAAGVAAAGGGNVQIAPGQKQQGICRKWDAVRGFGIVNPIGGGPDVFVHTKALTDGDSLQEGSEVIFIAEEDMSRPGRYRAKMCQHARATAQIIPGVQMQGVCTRWDLARGFGIVNPVGGGPDIFVHRRELTDGECLLEGSTITFVAEEDMMKGGGRYRAKSCSGAINEDKAPPPTPVDNLFVAGLPTDATDDSIMMTFGQYGHVMSVKILPPQRGRSDVAALVRMSSPEQAKWIVENLNGNVPSGLQGAVTCRYAEAKPRGPDKGLGKGSPYTGSYGHTTPQM